MSLIETRSWQRWSVVGLGVLVGASIGFHALIDRNSLAVYLQETIPLAVISLLLVFLGIRLARSDIDTTLFPQLLTWIAIGIAAFGFLGTWLFAHRVLTGMIAFDEVVQELTVPLASGALAGAGVGIYDVRRQQREEDLELATTALESTMDGVAILDKDDRYVFVNQSYADIHRCDAPEQFVGEQWRYLSSEANRERFAEEIRPVLAETGAWRGEAVIHRPDGRTVPEELTITELEDGGRVYVVRDITERKGRERELRSRVTAMDASIDGMAILDENGEYTYVNEAHAEVYGYDDPDTIVGETWQMCYGDDQLPYFEQQVMPALWADGQWRGEAMGKRQDGTLFPQELTLTALDDGGLVCVVRDVTDRKERERELETSEARFRSLTENTQFSVITIDEESIVRFANDAIEDTFGYAPDEVVGTPLTTLMPDRFEESHVEGIERYLREGTKRLDWEWIELPGLHADGHEFPIGVSFGTYAVDGEHLFTGVIHDITERKEYEQALERSEDLLEKTQRMANVGGWEYDVRRDEIRGTDEAYRLFGLPLDADLGLQKVLGFFHPEDVPALEDAIERAIERGESYDLELRVITANDELRWMNARGTPYQRGGETVLLRGAIQDITERKRTEQKIRALHDATREMMTAETRREVATVASETADEVLGLSLNALYRHESGAGLVPVAVSPEAQAAVGESPRIAPGDGIAWEVFETGEPQIYGDVREAPNVLNPETPIRTELTLPLGAHGVFILGSTTVDDLDDTDVALARVLAANIEVALEQVEHERELETLHDATRNMLRADTTREVCNLAADASKHVLGYSLTVVRLLDEDGETLTPVARTAETHERVGDRPTYSIHGTPAGRAFQQGTALVYDDLGTLDDENLDERYDRGAARAAMYVPLGDHGVISIADTTPGVFDRSDVRLANLLAANTEAAIDRVGREVQLRAQREDLVRQNDRLEEFASVVSHDLRNPLTIAMGYLDLLETADEQSMEKIRNAHDRMETIIEDVLTLARQGKSVGETEPVSVAAVAETAWNHVDTHDARLAIDDDRRTVGADEGRLERLFENLFRNAIEHGREDVTCRVGSTDQGFYVEDDGPGIPVDARDQVFEHGHTTSESGTGFGLSIVRTIAEAHGWAVTLTESKSGGARFEIRCQRPFDGILSAYHA